MKTLANCTPREFLKQTSRIRKSAEAWIELCNFKSIRAKIPPYEKADENATAEERAAVIKRNAEKLKKQSAENLSAMLDEALDKHPDETLELLALCCFIEPDDADNHSISEYMSALYELLNSKEVLDFFTLLVRLGRKNS